jgi:rhodanese-related sulfurtransferase
MTAKWLGASAAATLAFALALVWAPAAGRRAQALENQAERAITHRDVQVSPAELAMLMHNRHVDLALFDLRDEPAFNQFHLTDAKRVAIGAELASLRALPDKTVKVLMAEDEDGSLRAYRQLVRAGAKQVYVLAGGTPAWLALFAPAVSGGPVGLLAGAFGGRHPASYPDIEHTPLPKFEAKVKLGGSGGKKGPGGCGG